jgi:hypothetical protein
MALFAFRCVAAFVLLLAAGPGTAQIDLTLHRDGFERGLRCARVGAGEVVLALQSVRVEPVFRLDGQPFGDDPLQSATFWLIPTEGEAIALGNSFDPPGSAVRVLAGRYDVEYRWRAGDDVPANVGARVLRDVWLEADGPLLIDVPSHAISGALQLNGAAFPNNGGRLSLVGANRLGAVALGSTAEDSYAVRLIRGGYRLRYEALVNQLFMPANRSALRGHYEIDGSVDTLDLNLTSITATFAFRFNNVQAPDSGTENGVLSLRTPDGDFIELGQSRQQNVGWSLLAGRYDVYYEALTGASVAPGNPETRVQANRTILAGSNTINVPTIAIDGSFLIDGAPAPVSALQSGRVYLRDRLTGRDLQIGSTHLGYARRVIPASYDLVYARSAGTDQVPQNLDVVFERERAFSASATAAIDIPMAEVEVPMTLDGAPFPNSAAERASVYVRSANDATPVFVGDSTFFGNGGPQLNLVPGDYALLLAYETGANFIPRNSLATLAPDVLLAAASPDVQPRDVRSGEFDIEVSLDGAPFPAGAGIRAELQLRHRDDEVALGTTVAPIGPRRLATSVATDPDGRQATLYYRWLEGGVDALPQNVDTPAACLVFDAP